MSPRTLALLQALLVTFLWATSWILIKIGLAELPALTFGGLRYLLATGCLLPVAALTPRFRADLRRLTGADWRRLALLGLALYAVTQGAQFAALASLPAQTTSLLWSLSTVLVALAGIRLLSERPTVRQWCGVGLYLVGAMVFLYPAGLPAGALPGLVAAAVGVCANAGAAVLGRAVNRSGTLSPLTVTVLSMGIGSVALSATGLLTQGLPPVSEAGWLIVGWLAVVNTAAAFTLWNHVQRTLTATESSIVNSTMLIQIAVLAWVFLGESPGPRQLAGLATAAAGVLLVQWRGGPPAARRRPGRLNRAGATPTAAPGAAGSTRRRSATPAGWGNAR